METVREISFLQVLVTFAHHGYNLAKILFCINRIKFSLKITPSMPFTQKNPLTMLD